MSKEDFIKWLESSPFSREYSTYDDCWRELVDYADYTFDYLEVNDNKVIFKYEEKHWGYTSNEEREYTFEDFIASYEANSIK